MKVSEFKQIIKEEVEKTLDEASDLKSRVADLYGYSGVRTQYDSDDVKRYGQKTIDLAVEMAPKILAYKAELKKMVKEMEKSPEAKMLLKTIEASRAYGGDSSRATLGDLINIYT